MSDVLNWYNRKKTGEEEPVEESSANSNSEDKTNDSEKVDEQVNEGHGQSIEDKDQEKIYKAIYLTDRISHGLMQYSMMLHSNEADYSEKHNYAKELKEAVNELSEILGGL